MTNDLLATPPRGTRKRLEHIDAMRPVKQAAVISTHTLIFFAPLATSSTVVGLIMLTRFSRDAFLFVSACMLAFSYNETSRIDLVQYTKRRFVSVTVPYLAWTVIYYVYTFAKPVSGFPFYSFRGSGVLGVAGLHQFLHLLMTGYYHLYYLLVIMEFYVLFPLLLWAVRRAARWHVHVVVVALALQVVFGVLVSSRYFGFHLSGDMQTRLVTSYVVYLVGGVIVALHLDDIHDWITRHARLIIVATLASALVDEVFSYLGRFSWLPPYLRTGSRVFSPLIVPYDIGAILCVYLLGVYLVSSRRRLRTRAAVQSGSDNSYGVYLSQMIWIPILVRLRGDLGLHVPWPIAAPAALVIVYFLGFFFTAVVARTPLAKAVTGRSRASWASLWPRRFGSETVLRGDVGDGPMDLRLINSDRPASLRANADGRDAGIAHFVPERLLYRSAAAVGEDRPDRSAVGHEQGTIDSLRDQFLDEGSGATEQIIDRFATDWPGAHLENAPVRDARLG
jgi:peptidoglycan/LPS O-acetylase OafA/YrhL